MLRIYIDEAAAFDMLAILELKKGKSPNGEDNYNDFLEVIHSQINHEYLHRILSSDEYKELYTANAQVFDLIDEVVSDTCHPSDRLDALTVHNANMKRFYAKKALQEKFFGNALTEQKTVK